MLLSPGATSPAMRRTYVSPSASTVNSSWDGSKWRTSVNGNSGNGSPLKSVGSDGEAADLAFYLPRQWGPRNVELSTYWTQRFSRAVFSLAVVHIFLLIAVKLAAQLASDGFGLVWALPYSAVLILVAFSHCSIYLRDYTRHPVELETRFAAFCSLFALETTAEWSKFAVGGAAISWAFAAQLGGYYRGPVLLTNHLNEEDLYVVLNGAWFGSLFFLRRHFDFTRPRIRFPLVQRLKFLDFKAKARPTLHKSFKLGFWPTVYFTLAYHFLLSDVKHVVLAISLILDTTAYDIDRTWYELFNLRRFLVAYLCGVLTEFSFRMAEIILRIFLLAPQEFGIELFHRDQADLSLSEAIAESRVPVVRALAFRHLVNIARSSDGNGKQQRRKIYALNPAGDVPADWRALSADCWSSIERFAETLESFVSIAATRNVLWADDVTPIIPRQLALQMMRTKLERDQLTERRRLMPLAERLSFDVKQLIGRLPWLTYLFSDELDNRFRRAQRNCQEVLYSTAALSWLVTRSVDEDLYGVVQRDVPRILTTLTTLRDRLLTLRRLSPQCTAYANAVHRSLVRIWLAFPDSFGHDGLKHFTSTNQLSL